MRMSSDEPDEGLALETIAAAAQAGISVFDTAHSYGLDETELGPTRGWSPAASGMQRPGDRARRHQGRHDACRRRMGAGRAREGRFGPIARRASLRSTAADRPLPRPHARSADSVADLGACARATRRRRTREARRSRERQSAPARRGARARPITAVQVALSVYDDRALRGGVVERCDEIGVTLIAHSPLGGPRRAGRLSVRGARRRGGRRGAAPGGSGPRLAAGHLSGAHRHSRSAARRPRAPPPTPRARPRGRRP